jgi:hypothetical protein
MDTKLWSENLLGGDHLKDLGVDGRKLMEIRYEVVE